MKQVMKTIPLTLLLATLATPSLVSAQEKEKENVKVKKKTDAEQIIITRKGDDKEKIVIEVQGDKILVNGKEYDKDGADNIIIHRNKIKDVVALGRGGSVNFWPGGAGDQYRALTGMFNDDRAMLGVTTEKTEDGVEIKSITKESAAEKIGLKKGDIIKRVDETKIETPDDLSKVIGEKEAGDKVKVTYIRDKKESTATAELTKWKGVNTFTFAPGMEDFRMDLEDLELEHLMPRIQSVPSAPRLRGYSYNYGWSGGSPKLGLSVQDTEDGKGVKVLNVDEEGNGAKAGIKEEDIITEVDGKAVNNADEIARIMRDSKDKASVKFKIQRAGKSQTLDVKIPKKLKTAEL